MPADLQFIDSNINGYENIPVSIYPVLPGVALTSVSVNHQSSQIFDGILPSVSGVYFKWKYPVSDNLYIRVAVGYQLQIIEGTFSKAECQSIVAPGTIIYEEIVNLKDETLPADRYINLQAGAIGQVNIGSAVIKGGTKYTVRVRALIFSELGNGTIGDQYFKYTEWGIVNFKVNSSPTAINLRTNGLSNPIKIPKTDPISFSFTFNDLDGPAYLYRVQVGTTPGVGFAANIWDSGLIAAGLGSGPKEFKVQFSGDQLSENVTYAWRVQVQDGLADGGWTNASDTFKINTAPTVSSLTIDGNELLFGETPTVADSGIAIAWTFEDAEGDTQRAYNLTVSQILLAIVDDFNLGTTETVTQVFEILSTGNVFSDTASVDLPDLPNGGDIQVKLKVRDSVEFGEEVIGTFKVNAKPKVLDLKVDGKINPGDVSTDTPVFSWTFFDSTPGDIQRAYRIQVSTNDAFETLLWDTGLVTSNSSEITYASVGSPVVSATALTHGAYYFARVLVYDGISLSDYEQTFFAINTKPNSPTILTPTPSVSYSGIITVSWLSADPQDDDGDTITYNIEMTNRRSSDQGWEFLAGPFLASTTAFSLDTSDIKAGNDYGVRVIANDGFADSDPTLGTSAVNGSGLGFTILNHAPVSPTFIYPKLNDIISTSLKIEWLEADPVDVDGDSVFYILEMTRNSVAADPTYEKIGVFNEGSNRTFIDVSNLEDGSAYKLRITAQDDKGGVGEENYSDVFSIINTSAITDFEQLGSTTYVSTTDGRVFKATESIWQVEENFVSEEEMGVFDTFVRGDSAAEIKDGLLEIKSAPGATYILRIGLKPTK